VEGDAQNDVRGTYDRVASEYVSRIYDELRHKPLDRELLDRFAAAVPAGQLVCDLGCGPGHVGRYLHERDARVCGVDLSPAMIARARELNPAIKFMCADMRELPIADSSWAGVVAFYAIVNLAANELATVFGEIRRVLQPGGLLLLSFHLGDETVHLSEWWSLPVSIDFHFFSVDEVVTPLKAAGFVIEELHDRLPYPEVEHPSRRAYILARKVAHGTRLISKSPAPADAG
jgi:SAM-dependent methyltransferase